MDLAIVSMILICDKTLSRPVHKCTMACSRACTIDLLTMTAFSFPLSFSIYFPSYIFFPPSSIHSPLSPKTTVFFKINPSRDSCPDWQSAQQPQVTAILQSSSSMCVNGGRMKPTASVGSLALHMSSFFLAQWVDARHNDPLLPFFQAAS